MKHLSKFRSWLFALLEMIRRWQWNFCECTLSPPPVPAPAAKVCLRVASGTWLSAFRSPYRADHEPAQTVSRLNICEYLQFLLLSCENSKADIYQG